MAVAVAVNSGLILSTMVFELGEREPTRHLHSELVLRRNGRAAHHGEHSRYNEHQPNWNFHDGSLLHLRLHVDLFVKQSLPVRWHASGRSGHRLIWWMRLRSR